jgi:hypothetical protein
MMTTKTHNKIRKMILAPQVWRGTSEGIEILADREGRPVLARGEAWRVIQDLRSRGWEVVLRGGTGEEWRLEARSLLVSGEAK